MTIFRPTSNTRSEAQLKAGVDELALQAQTHFGTWKTKESQTLLEIETKKKTLEDQGIVLDI